MKPSKEQVLERERLAKLGLKQCLVRSGCGLVKPLDEFGLNKRRSDKKNTICRTCNRNKSNQYQKENREARNAYSHQYYLDNIEEKRKYSRTHGPKYYAKKQQDDPMYYRLQRGKERAKKAGAEWQHISTTDLLSHWEQEDIDAEVCYYCKQTVNTDDLHLDHGIPLSKGGSHSIDNLFPAHKSCNLSKGERTVEEYLNYLKQAA